MKLTYANGAETRDITAYTGKYERSDNMNALGQAFTFSLLSNPADALADGRELELGGKIVFSRNGQTPFSGVIVSVDRSTLHEFNYTAFDYAFYLNKSEVFVQFNDITTADALKRLCAENSIPVGAIADIPTKVSKIYKGQVISDVMRDLLEMATADNGTEYRFEVRGDRLYIEKYVDLVVEMSYKPAGNVGAFNPADLIGSFSESRSIEELKNKVLVVGSSEKNQQIFATEEDAESQKRFGTLQKVETVDDKNEAQARNIAKNTLATLNRETRTLSVVLFGDDRVRAGRTIIFDSPAIGLVGRARVKSCRHSYESEYQHFMNLELEV